MQWGTGRHFSVKIGVVVSNFGDLIYRNHMGGYTGTGSTDKEEVESEEIECISVQR